MGYELLSDFNSLFIVPDEEFFKAPQFDSSMKGLVLS